MHFLLKIFSAYKIHSPYCFNGFKSAPRICIDEKDSLTGYEYLNLSLVCDSSMDYDEFITCVNKETFEIEEILQSTTQLINYDDDFEIR